MKPSSAAVNLGPWIKGIQNLYDPAMTPKGSVVEANNVLIESDGSVTPRAGYAPVAVGVHSLFCHNGTTYGVLGGKVYDISTKPPIPIESHFSIQGPVTWSVLNDEPVFTNPSVLARIRNGKAKRIGVEKPIATTGVAVTPIGTLDIPDTAIEEFAISFVNDEGEEGPLSVIAEQFAEAIDPDVVSTRKYVQIKTKFLLSVPAPAASEATAAEGAQQTGEEGEGEPEEEAGLVEPYFAATEMLWLEGSVGPSGIGVPPETMNKDRMPGGNYVRYWRGRLLVARGRTLYISDPLRYGLYDQSRGFVTFEAKIDFIEPVETGIFVALRNIGVVFLAGDSPDKWERRTADVVLAQPGASTVIPTALMDLKLQQKPEWVAVWFTNKGFALGLPSGNVMYPQADLLSGLPLGTGSLHFDGADRLIVMST